jgi:pyruvate/2-oxoglutarate dehydrogenase complex dihydrolipoamide acyltransferase (E2) component
MNNVLNFRKTEKQKGNKFSFNAILMQAIAKSLKTFIKLTVHIKTMENL